MSEKPDSRIALCMLVVQLSYGFVLALTISGVLGVWSGLHSLALFILLFVLTPATGIQGLLIWRWRARGGRHHLAFWLSVLFPPVVATITLLFLTIGN